MKNLVKTMLMRILTAGTMMSFTACSSEDDVLMETKGNISNGELADSLSLDDMGISTSNKQACNPELMEQVLKYAYSHYPANEYGLVLGGHSTGWLIEQEPGGTRAFGVDNGDGYAYSNNSKRWISWPVPPAMPSTWCRKRSATAMPTRRD